MPKTKRILSTLCLLFLLPFTLFAQDATATAPALNCSQATTERSLVSGLFLSEVIAPTELDWYYFQASEADIWRFDVSTIHPLIFDFYQRGASQPFLSVSANPQGIVSTAFRSSYTGIYCLRTSNPGEVNMDYNIRLTVLEDVDGQMPGAEDLTTSEAYNLVGDYYYDLGNYDSALLYYYQASTINPSDALAWSNSCAAFYQLGFYNAAIGDCSQSLNINSQSNDALWFRAASYETLGLYSSALSDYQALADRSNDAIYPYNLAINYIFLGDAASALTSMERVYNNSNYENKAYWRGVARLYAADYAGAILDFETYIAQTQENPYYVYFLMGISHRASGNQLAAEDAFASAGRLLQLADNPVLKHRWTALSLLVGGDAEAARIHYRQILRLEPHAHQRRNDFIYLTVLARIFPDDRIYAETFSWLREELDIH